MDSLLCMFPSPLELDGWVEFSRMKWSLDAERLRLTTNTSGLPCIQGVIYTDKRGRVVQPPRNPYLPMRFVSTPTCSLPRLERQWRSVSELAIHEFRRRGMAGAISLQPGINDLREWQWSGFPVSVKYTYVFRLPHAIESADSAVRKQISKANSAGFRCCRPADLSDVVQCLADTERRQGFEYDITIDDLVLAGKLLGEDCLRVYGCYAPNGRVASARVVLLHPEGYAVDWLAGTKTDDLRSGATQFLFQFVLDDLSESGSRLFDHCGANLRSVSAAKATWGGELVSYYTVRQPNFRYVASALATVYRFREGDCRP